MKKTVMAMAAMAAAAMPMAAQAGDDYGMYDDPIGVYQTVISPQDTVNSSGNRLRSVGAILRQDRANMHRFGRADAGDQYEDMFLSSASRALIPGWVSNGYVDPSAAAAIRNGRAYVTVYVYEGRIEVLSS
ncbi:hypothetical protein [Parasphingopyxis sp.]|uniref:hypothetical protein n=1 Tax=Parasphingopyxis sp. TaxID=1920299 RepID=UPI002624DFDB|nr:hypothetical protein [Parasphingopyxis sp.]